MARLIPLAGEGGARLGRHCPRYRQAWRGHGGSLWASGHRVAQNQGGPGLHGHGPLGPPARACAAGADRHVDMPTMSATGKLGGLRARRPPEGARIDHSGQRRLEGIVRQQRADPAARDTADSGLRSESGRLRSESGRLRSENTGLRSLAAAQREALEGAGIRIKDMERREAYRDNPNVPPSRRPLTLL